MADLKQRQAAANQAFFEQKAQEYTRETGEKWTAKDVANHFEMVVRDMTERGNTARSVLDTWNEIAEYNGLNAPDADLYYGSDKTLGWNDYKSSTAITRDALQWGINTGAIKGTPSEQKTLFDAIQKSFNNIDSLSSLPAGFEEAVSTSNALLGRTVAPVGGTLSNLLGNVNKPTPSVNDVLPGYSAKSQQRMPAGRQPSVDERTLQSLQGIKSGINMQRALNMLPQIDPADRIAAAQLKSSQESRARSAEFGARFDRNQKVNDAIFAANMGLGPKFGGLPVMGKSSAIEQLRDMYAAGSAQRFNPGKPASPATSRFAMEAPVNRTTARTGALGTTGFTPGSIPQMMPSGAMNVMRPGDGTVRAGFNSTVPGTIDVASAALNPQRIADTRTGLRAPSYPQAIPLSRPNIDVARFNNVPTAQPNMTANDVRNSYHRGLVQQASVPAATRTPANTVGANSYFADPRVSGYMPGQSTGLRSVGGKTVGNQFSGMPTVSYATMPASVTWGGMANAGQTNRGFTNAAQISNRNAEIGRALQEKAAVYGTGGPAVDVMPAAATRTVAPNSPPVDANIQPAPSYNVSVAPNGVSTATQIDPATLQANQGFGQRIAGAAVRAAPAMIGGALGGPVGGLLGALFGALVRSGVPQQQIAQQAAQAVQVAAPALGQVMGLPAAMQAARAGANMVLGRDASGRLGWSSNGDLSGGARGAGWISNNPERNYGGYGGGYDPTPV